MKGCHELRKNFRSRCKLGGKPKQLLDTCNHFRNLGCSTIKESEAAVFSTRGPLHKVIKTIKFFILEIFYILFFDSTVKLSFRCLQIIPELFVFDS